MSEAEAEAEATWLANEERGTLLGIRFVVGLCTLLGRGPARLFVRFLMVYYTVFGAGARRASRQWLEVALGRPATLREVYRHLCTFGLVTLDRIFLLRGRADLFHVVSHGTEHLAALTEEGRGALLLGAHLGSFEAMRLQSEERGYDVHILSYMENAQKLQTVLSALAPEMQEKVVPLGTTEALLHAREIVDGGAIVALLGDRVGMNEKITRVDFLGRSAPLPTGPYLLAKALRCPVYMVFGVYRGGNHYDVYCEPLVEQVKLPRGAGRDEALGQLAQRYADRVAHHAMDAPFNWFNVYDFWNPSAAGDEVEA